MSFALWDKKGLRPEVKEKEPHYTSQKKSNPHATPSKRLNSWYKDHGKGNHFEEEEEYDEDRVQKGHSRNIW